MLDALDDHVIDCCVGDSNWRVVFFPFGTDILRPKVTGHDFAGFAGNVDGKSQFFFVAHGKSSSGMSKLTCVLVTSSMSSRASIRRMTLPAVEASVIATL